MRKIMISLLGILIASFLLCGVLSFMLFGGQVITAENGITMTAGQSARMLDLLEEMRGRKGELVDVLKMEMDKLQTYIVLLEMEKRGYRVYGEPKYTDEEKNIIRANYSLDLVQARELEGMLKYIYRQIEYCNSYKDYNAKIQAQADKLVAMPIFAGTAQKNIRKTARDFYYREDCSPKPISTLGIRTFLENSVSVVVIISAAILCAIYLVENLRKCDALPDGKYLQIVTSWLLVIWFALIAALPLMVVKMTWGLDDLRVPVQSIPQFQTCQYNISVLTLLMVQIVCGSLGGLVLFWIAEGILCLRKPYLGMGAAATAAMVDYYFLKGHLYHCFFAGYDVVTTYKNQSIFGIMISRTTLCLISALTVLVTSCIWAGKRLREVLRLEKERTEKLYYDEINSRYREIRVLRHDINNHLAAVNYLLDNNKLEEAKQYLSEISEEMAQTKLPEKTGIDALDMILWRKLSQAKGNDIYLQLDIQDQLKNTDLSDYEMCSLFGNLLDNAIEAVLRVEGNREIRLSVVRQMDMICIFCENPYKSVNKEEGKFITVKADKSNHGLGIGQMEHIAAKHGGRVKIQTDNHIFSVSIMLLTKE